MHFDNVRTVHNQCSFIGIVWVCDVRKQRAVCIDLCLRKHRKSDVVQLARDDLGTF